MKTLKYNLILLAGLIPLLIACNKNHKDATKQDNVLNIKVQKLTEEIVVFPIRTSGRLSVKSEQKLSFRTGGIIKKIYVKAGQTVAKGTVLAELNLSEIQAQVNIANEAFEKAKRDFNRAKNLYEDSVATLELYQNAKTALQLARSNLNIADFNLKYSKIYAPAKGKILKKLMEENEMVGVGYPVLLFGSLQSQWTVKVNVTDKDIVTINPGDSAHIYFDAYPNILFPGYVNEIAGMADPYTGTYEVEISLTNLKGKKMATGFIAKAEILPNKKEKLLAIPIDALFDEKETIGYVFEVVDSVAVKHKIHFNFVTNKKVYVNRNTLKPGDLVVTEGMNYINENTILKVETVN